MEPRACKESTLSLSCTQPHTQLSEELRLPDFEAQARWLAGAMTSRGAGSVFGREVHR
jgi:hypothetical protein